MYLVEGPALVFEIKADFFSVSLDGFVPKGRNIFFISHVFSHYEFHFDEHEDAFDVSTESLAHDPGETPSAEKEQG